MNTKILFPNILLMSILVVLCLALLAAAFILGTINAASPVHGGIMIIHTPYPIV